MAIDFVKGGSLYQMIKDGKAFVEEDVRTIMTLLLKIVEFFHALNIIHKDLKPDNILVETLEDGQVEVRIADFGIAEFVTEGEVN